MKQLTIYRRHDANTRPGGFGNPPTYHIDEPRHSDTEMIWVDPVQITIPEGYRVAESNGGDRLLYDPQGRYVEIVDRRGHPAIITGAYRDKRGELCPAYAHLDKAAADATNTDGQCDNQ